MRSPKTKRKGGAFLLAAMPFEKSGGSGYTTPVYSCRIIWLAAALMATGLGAAPAQRTAPGRPAAEADDWLFSKDGARLVDSRRQPVVLRNNPNAKDVPLQQVLEFVKANQVNTQPYQTGTFVCTEFAVTLHDAAEAAGIRCGIVGVRFQRGAGHALNVFKTTDKGLVYVDCTSAPHPGRDPERFDTIGYLRIGQPYGRLPLEIGAFDPNHYERFTYVMGLWNRAMAEQAQLTAGRRELAAKRAKLAGDAAAARTATAPDLQTRLEQLQTLQEQEEALQKQREEIFARYEKSIAQFRRLGVRYDMNPAPVRKIDVWW